MRHIVLLGAVLLAIGYPGLRAKAEGHDWGYWNKNIVKARVSDFVNASMEAEFRLKKNASKYSYQHTHIQLDLKVSKWLVISPAYRETFFPYGATEDDDDWFPDHRPMLNAAVKFDVAGWKVKNRGRLAYRMFEIDREDVFRFRNMLTVRAPWKVTALNLSPWIMDEVWLEEGKDGIWRNWSAVGFGVDLMEHVKADLYYLWEATDSGVDWNHVNVVGTKMKVVF